MARGEWENSALCHDASSLVNCSGHVVTTLGSGQKQENENIGVV